MTNTLLTPTDDRTVFGIDPFDIDTLAAELHGISSNILIVSSIVEPKVMQDVDTPSDNTVQEAFFAIMRNLEHVADELIDLEERLMKAQKTTATPTDESKDCR